MENELLCFQIFHGNQTLDEVMSRLLSAQETFNSQLASEVRDEEQREARDAVKREQDLAYEMSLQVGAGAPKTQTNDANCDCFKIECGENFFAIYYYYLLLV